MNRPSLARVGLLACGLGLGVVLCEVALRRVSFVPAALQGDTTRESTLGKCTELHLTRGWAPIPGACRYDERGLRGPVDAGDPSGPQLLVVGDSVAAQDHWIRALASRWEVSAGAPLTAWNAGVSGYHPCQTDIALDHALSVVEADLVLIQLCHNDLHGTGSLVPLEDGRVRYFVGNRAMDLPAWVLRSRALSLGVLVAGERWAAREFTQDRDAEVDQTARCLRSMAARLERAQIPGVVALFPVLLPSDRAASEWPRALEEEEILRDLAGSLGLPLVDLRPVYEAHAATTSFLDSSTDIVHPSEEGQTVFGEVLADALLARHTAGHPGD